MYSHFYTLTYENNLYANLVSHDQSTFSCFARYCPISVFGFAEAMVGDKSRLWFFTVLLIRIRAEPVFLGSLGSGSGSDMKWFGSATLVFNKQYGFKRKRTTLLSYLSESFSIGKPLNELCPIDYVRAKREICSVKCWS